jgi:hypothetical protein
MPPSQDFVDATDIGLRVRPTAVARREDRDRGSRVKANVSSRRAELSFADYKYVWEARKRSVKTVPKRVATPASKVPESNSHPAYFHKHIETVWKDRYFLNPGQSFDFVWNEPDA